MFWFAEALIPPRAVANDPPAVCLPLYAFQTLTRAKLLGYGTEELALRLGETLGGRCGTRFVAVAFDAACIALLIYSMSRSCNDLSCNARRHCGLTLNIPLTLLSPLRTLSWSDVRPTHSTGLINASLGNAVELIIAILALIKCQLQIGGSNQVTVRSMSKSKSS